MAFLQLVCTASKLKNLRDRLTEEKVDAIKVSQKGKPKKRLRHLAVDIRLCIKRFLRNLLGCFCCRKFSYKLLHDGTCENYTAKSIIGFVSGFILTYIFFMFCVFQLSFRFSTATLMCSILGCILTIGLAFSSKVRCVVFLTLPQFFSQKGRQALLAYAFILAIAGPAKNILNNMGILSESLACGQEQLKVAVRQIIDVIKKPFLALKEAIKNVVKKVKEIIKKIKEILLKIKRIIMAILRVIKAAFLFLANIINICNKELGTPFERCSRVFENAIADCNAKLGPLFNWLCSLAYIVQSVCYLVKFLDLICIIVDFISNSVIGVVVRKVKTFIRHIKTMFYVRIRFSHSFQFQTNTSRSMTEVAHEIVEEIKDRTQHLRALFNFMTSIATLFFLFIIFRVLYYRFKFLTSERFDNKYINKDFRQLDMRRAKLGKETVLPLNNREVQNYITVGNRRLAKSEKQQLSKSITTLATASLKLAIYMATDFSLFWILNLIRYYGKFQSQPQLPNLPNAHVSGHGFLADLLRSIVKAFQPVGIQLEIDTIPCLPTPIPPNFDRYLQIVTLMILCWVLALLEPYGLRLRHKVMCYYHPTRAKQRTIWLYNNILRSRNSFLKFARRQLRRKAMGDKSVTKITCKEYLAANFKVFRLCLGDGVQVACILCGEVFRESDNKKPIKCKTPGCPGIYCEKCFADLQNLCTICLSPIDYGDLSDISEEKDSSEEGPKYIEPETKKRKKRKWWCSPCLDICFPDEGDEKGSAPTKRKKKRAKKKNKKKGDDNMDSSDDGEGSRLLKSDEETGGREEGNKGATKRGRSMKSKDSSYEETNDKEGGTKQDMQKKAKDSDYYSSGSTTDYSYSYQYAEKPPNVQPSHMVTFRDVEKQELPDYASMGSFREEPTYNRRMVKEKPRDKDLSSSPDESLPTDDEDAPMIPKRKGRKKTPYMAELAVKSTPYIEKPPRRRVMDEYLLNNQDEHLHSDTDVPKAQQGKVKEIPTTTGTVTVKQVVDDVSGKYGEHVPQNKPSDVGKIHEKEIRGLSNTGKLHIDGADMPKIPQTRPGAIPSDTRRVSEKVIRDKDIPSRFIDRRYTDSAYVPLMPQERLGASIPLDTGKISEIAFRDKEFTSKFGDRRHNYSADVPLIPQKGPGAIPLDTEVIRDQGFPSRVDDQRYTYGADVSLIPQKRHEAIPYKVDKDRLPGRFDDQRRAHSAVVPTTPHEISGEDKLPEKRIIDKNRFPSRFGDQIPADHADTHPIPQRPAAILPDTGKVSSDTAVSETHFQEPKQKMLLDVVSDPTLTTSYKEKEEAKAGKKDTYSSDTDDSDTSKTTSVNSTTYSTDMEGMHDVKTQVPSKIMDVMVPDISETDAYLPHLHIDIDRSPLDPEIKEYLRYVEAILPDLGLQEARQYIVVGGKPSPVNHDNPLDSSSSIDSEIKANVQYPPRDSSQSVKSSSERKYALNMFSHVKYDEISESPRSSTNASSLHTDGRSPEATEVSSVVKTIRGTTAGRRLSNSSGSSSTDISSLNRSSNTEDTQPLKTSKQTQYVFNAQSTSDSRSGSTYTMSADADKLGDTVGSKTSKVDDGKSSKISTSLNTTETLTNAASKSKTTKERKVDTNVPSSPQSQSSTNLWSLTTGDRLRDTANSNLSIKIKESTASSTSTVSRNTKEKLPIVESKGSKMIMEIKAPINVSQSTDSYTFESNQRKKVKEYYKTVKELPSNQVVGKKKTSRLSKFFHKFLPKRKKNPDGLPWYSKNIDTVELKSPSQEDWDVLSTRHSAQSREEDSIPVRRILSEEERSRIRGGETGQIRNWYRLRQQYIQEPLRSDYVRDYIPLKDFTNYSQSTLATEDLLSRYFVSIEDLTPTRDSDIPMTAVDNLKSSTPFGKGELIRELPEKDNSQRAQPDREPINISESSSSELSLGLCKEILGPTVVTSTPAKQFIEQRRSTSSTHSDSKHFEGLESIKETTSEDLEPTLIASTSCICELLPTRDQKTQTRLASILKNQQPSEQEVVTLKGFSSRYCKQVSDTENSTMDRCFSKDQTMEAENYSVRGTTSNRRCKVILTTDKTQQTSDNEIYSCCGTGSSCMDETKVRCTFVDSDNMQSADNHGYRCSDRRSPYGKCNCNRCNCICPPPPPPPRCDTFLQRTADYNRCSEKYPKCRRDTPSEYSVRSNTNAPRKGYRETPADSGYAPREPQCKEVNRDFAEHCTEGYMRSQKSANIMICSCSGDCKCCMKKLRPCVRSPQKYRHLDYDSSSSNVSDDEVMNYDGDDSYCPDNPFDLPYQHNEEYLELVQELEETLQSRNRNRVRRAMQEFEHRSKYNKPLERPIIDYDHTSESEEPIIQRITQLTSDHLCRCCAGDMCTCRKTRSRPRQRSKVQTKPCKVQQQRPKSCSRNTCPQLSPKTHWKMDTSSGEWFKVATSSQRGKGRCKSRTPSPRKEYCPHDCSCCVSKRYDYL